ncbi:Glycosyltransferase involved in cell wall bisynthesis [Flavobacterium sp. CF108]|uniref:glycosyltransferase family 4 protein n=1 Tax=unclassified Flavobacterium TaxID=196869 RepID=UPI0008B47768|nr:MULTISPECIES: glycosyltransferase family 1 protein [unclassified Flavobacterium]SEO49982.1 Glycosyltransferase involved in cell wall bisynthesis [Flavobacterium sp. fv08]SHH72524.1 Glycosyltransferase involved in cell wall bisynthesis [Flavobacterium sp. CF108]
MKIAINCIYYEAGGGIKEYIHNLVKELISLNNDFEYVFYISKAVESTFIELTKGKGKIKIFPFESNKKIKRALLQKYFWKKEEKEEKFNIFHSTFFHSPKFKNAKVILTVHDLRFLNFPKSYEFKRYFYLKYAVKKSIKNADKIITISNFTKDEVIKFYKIEEYKIKAIHEAVDSDAFVLKNNSNERMIKENLVVSNKYILAVGHLEPRKNYIRLIEAFLILPQTIQDNYKLIIVGKKNYDYDDILSTISKTTEVIYLDFISRDDLVWLYANCKIHVFPSYYEGFGFPSLEAGLFSKPTIGANQSSIAEISGEGGLYFDPFSVEDIKEKIKLALTDEILYLKLSSNALLNTTKFSWKRNAVDTCEIYNHFRNKEKELFSL